MKAETKTARVSARISPNVYNTLTEASEIMGSTLNQFIVHAALEKAQAIIEHENKIRLNKQSAQHLFELIEKPPKGESQTGSSNETVSAGFEMIKIELLDKSHDRTRFDCGNTQLNIFLQKTARQHITNGMSRTFVLINDENSKEILGFYTLSICEVETDYLPPVIAKKYPDQVPALKLARLAVSKKHQHKGYGNYLIGSAVEKVIFISENVGIIGLFVDAKDPHAKEYYEQFGFISLKGKPLLLFLPIKTLVQYK